MSCFISAFLCLFLSLLLAGFAESFSNPIIPGDWSDPGVIRVGSDYYSLRSSFAWKPGLPIAHSKDLIHWKYIGYVFKDNPLIANGDTGGGTYGSEIDFNPNKQTFVVYTPIGNGIYAYASTRPEGPYNGPYDLKLDGHYDPGFFADDDGKLYLVMTGGRIVELSPDGLSVLRETGNVKSAATGSMFEGPDIFKHEGYYYCIYSVGGTRPHQHSTVSTVKAKNLAGPWEADPDNPQLQADDITGAQFQGPAHGTLVDTPDGKWYVTYHAHELSHYSLGRQMCIEEIEWTADGWWKPKNGKIPSASASTEQLPSTLADSDEFNSTELGLQWFFASSPDFTGESWSLSQKPGWLRINTKPGDISSAASLCNVFLQRVIKKRFEVSAKLDFDAKTGREAAGIHFFHDPGMSFWLTSSVRGGKKVFEVGRYVDGKRTSLFLTPNKIGSSVYLKIAVDGEETATFYISRNGNRWVKVGGSVYFGDSWKDLRSGRSGCPDLGWVGPGRRNVWTAATTGVFAVQDGADSPNTADFDWFRVRL